MASAEEENAAAPAAAEEEEEELRQTNLERQIEAASADLEWRMEAVAESDKISKRGIKKAAKEVKVKAVAAISTAFLSFLVGVRTDRCTMF